MIMMITTGRAMAVAKSIFESFDSIMGIFRRFAGADLDLILFVNHPQLIM